VTDGPEPFHIRPDPEKIYYVQPKGGKLVRRGKYAYSIVWTKPNGQAAETPLAGRLHRPS
jgi:hypothetical protein